MKLKFAKTLELGDTFELAGQDVNVDYVQDPQAWNTVDHDRPMMDLLVINPLGKSIEMKVDVDMAFLVKE